MSRNLVGDIVSFFTFFGTAMREQDFQLLCTTNCNRFKGAKPLEEVLSLLEQRQSEICRG